MKGWRQWNKYIPKLHSSPPSKLFSIGRKGHPKMYARLGVWKAWMVWTCNHITSPHRARYNHSYSSHSPPRIPPNATVEFEIELLRFQRPEVQVTRNWHINRSLLLILSATFRAKNQKAWLNELKMRSKIKMQETHRYNDKPGGKLHNVIIGFVLYTFTSVFPPPPPPPAPLSPLIHEVNFDIWQALGCFAGLVEEKLSSEERILLNEIRLPLYNNLALCCLKLNEITKAIENSQKVRRFPLM